MKRSAPIFRNAAEELLGRSVRLGRGQQIAYVSGTESYSFDDVSTATRRAANALREMGVAPGERVVLCLADSLEFVATFLGAIQAGIVPVPVNMLWTAADCAHVLHDSGAKAAVVSEERLELFLEAARMSGWSGQIISCGAAAGRFPRFQELLAKASENYEPWEAAPDAECFWLYTSGSTGKPKAAMHQQRSMGETARLYAEGVLRMHPEDVIYSAAKMPFAYGLGNSVSFPLYTGAKVVMEKARPTPDLVNRILREHQPTIFFGVPTLFASLLQSSELPRCGEHSLRFCVSAGEALPADLGRAWKERTGVDILDGIGSTEMLHIFLSNSPGSVAYGTTGRPIPGYQVKLLDDEGQPTRRGEIGDLWVSGPSCCTAYWNQPEKTRETFVDGWMRTGDKYRETPEGDYAHCGRSDEMLKVGGLWVSPLEVEMALASHAAVREAAVIGWEDERGLVKPKAYVVLRPGHEDSAEMEEELKAFVKGMLAPYKYPRWIKIVAELPRTATGKLRRFQLREL